MKHELDKQDATRFFALMTMQTDFTITACIWRAYQDFCRTLHGMRSVYGTDQAKNQAESIIETMLNQCISVKLEVDDFDNLHRITCHQIKEMFESIVSFRIGQSQKWVNMSLKYMYYLHLANLLVTPSPYERSVLDYNARWFHMPVDNIVLEDFRIGSIYRQNVRTALPWSRTDSYDDYLRFQVALRSHFTAPLLVVENEV